MSMIVVDRAARSVPPAITGPRAGYVHLDPLDEDRTDDEVVVTTRRAICRVALVATEAAGRFERDAVPYDPMSWMLSPRTLFGGASAVDACLGRDDCLRGVLIHGLSLGLDADPDAIDDLTADEEGEGAGELVGLVPDDGPSDSQRSARRSPDGLRLFTATVVSNDGFEIVQAFHASLAMDEAEVAGRLYCRMGAASADARIVDGFDPAEPLVGALVSDAICDTLAIIAGDPSSPIAAGLDVNIEQRFLG